MLGFTSPVTPTHAQLGQAGAAVPVKFSLAGDRGLNIFAATYPRSEKIGCDSSALVDGIEETVNAGASSPQYDPFTNQHTYVWKTDKSLEEDLPSARPEAKPQDRSPGELPGPLGGGRRSDLPCGVGDEPALQGSDHDRAPAARDAVDRSTHERRTASATRFVQSAAFG